MLLKGGQEYICSCFFKRNIFLKKYKLHVVYENQDQFHDQYRQLLRMRGCTTDGQYKDVLEQISTEIKRRNGLHELTAQRIEHFKGSYVRQHPEIWNLNESLLDPNFLKIVADAGSKSLDKVLHSVVNHGGNITEMEIYQFPVFTSDMCRRLIEEMEDFEQTPHPKTRPNTMNKYGVTLEEMGLAQELIVPLVQNYLLPICAVLFPSWGGAAIDSFKAFSVKYEMGNDLELGEHYDNAEVTLNINLSQHYQGGSLQFGRMFDEEESKGEKKYTFEHQEGHGILHCGRRMHSALPITQGSRTNLIIWMRSSAVRNTLCPMCYNTPTLTPVPAAGEGFLTNSQGAWNWGCSLT